MKTACETRQYSTYRRAQWDQMFAACVCEVCEQLCVEAGASEWVHMMNGFLSSE